MAINSLNCTVHFIMYTYWMKITSVGQNSTKSTLTRITGTLTSMVYLIYVKLRECLSAVLNQGHNQQSAKNVSTSHNYSVSTITIKLLCVQSIDNRNIVQLPHNTEFFR